MYFLRFVLSIYKRIVIQMQRGYDHLYRYINGLPTMKYSQITPDLYLGGQYKIRAISILKKRGITAVVNMRMRSVHDDAERDLSWLKILHLPTPDLTAPKMKDLQKGVAFIQKEIRNGGKVYVHCRAGEGRGPTMALSYLIAEGMTYVDALAEVQKVRTFAKPTPPQVQRLKEFEELTQKEMKQKVPLVSDE
jgi:dual specificity MAP kinase phosphatase